MSIFNGTALRSDLNPILRAFRYAAEFERPSFHAWSASDWAQRLTAAESPEEHWLYGATVSEQVFAARVLYRYAAVFA